MKNYYVNLASFTLALSLALFASGAKALGCSVVHQSGQSSKCTTSVLTLWYGDRFEGSFGFKGSATPNSKPLYTSVEYRLTDYDTNAVLWAKGIDFEKVPNSFTKDFTVTALNPVKTGARRVFGSINVKGQAVPIKFIIELIRVAPV